MSTPIIDSLAERDEYLEHDVECPRCGATYTSKVAPTACGACGHAEGLVVQARVDDVALLDLATDHARMGDVSLLNELQGD